MTFPLSGFPDNPQQDDPLGPLSLQPPRPSPSPVSTGALSAFPPDPTDTLTDAMQRAATTKPDTAARIFGLQIKTGLPHEVIERNLDEVEKRAAAADFDPVAFRKNSPYLASWLEQHPLNASLVSDDLVPLTAIERTLRAGRNVAGAAAAGVAGFAQGIWGAIEATAERGTSINAALAAAERRPEITALAAPEEAAFQQWVATNQIADVDHPSSFYDYRGYFKAHGPTPMQFGVDHFPDTFKQHGHPTFSVESQYSRGPLDGGVWAGDTFIAPKPGTLDQIAAFAAGSAAVAHQLADRFRGTQAGAGFIERNVYGGIESLTQNVPGIAAGLVAGPSALLTLAGVTTGGQAYGQARTEGVSVNQATAFAAFQGAVEVATEFIPAHKLLGDLAVKAPLVTLLAHQIASEIPGEEVATVLQDLGEWAVLPSNKEKTFQDYLRERPSAAAATAISTLVAVGATTISTHAAARFVEKLGTDAAESKTIPRSPEAAESLIASATKDGAETLYAPIETWNTYWQTQGIDPAVKAAELTGSSEAYAFAVQSGGDLAIPTARYVTQIAPTEHNAYFVNELRLDPDAMNGRELEALTKQLETQPLETTEPPALSPLRTAIEARLVAAGVPASQAAAYAELADVVTTLSERSGVDLQARHGYGIDIVRPELAALQPGIIGPESAALPATAPPETGLIGPPDETPLSASSQPAAEAIVAPVDAQGVPITATFLGLGPSGPLYNIVGGPSDRSTVSAAELAAQGIPIPETPADGGARLSGEQLRAQAMATRAAARLDVAPLVDIPAATAQTETADGSAESETRVGPREARLPARNRIAPSYPRVRESAPQRARREAAHVEGVFTQLLESAQAVDPAVDPVDLRAEFDFRLDAWKSIRADTVDSGHDPLDLLRAIADAGGLNEESASGWRGELADLKSGTKFGAVAGVPKVFRATTAKDSAGRPITGLPFDVMQQRLQQDPRFAWIENVNMLFDALDEVIRNPPDLEGLPGTDELRADVQIDERLAWWENSWRPVEFDVSEFDQGPKVDTLPTGEQQPRLPGDVGEVREQDVVTPTMEAPFALTSEIAKPGKYKSKLGTLFTELFQEPPSPAPVATLTGNELGEGLTAVADIRAAAMAYYTRELQHGIRTVERPGFGTVTFTDTGKRKVKSTSANPDKLRMIPAVPAIIAQGTYEGRFELDKPRTDGVVAFHHFVGDVRIGEAAPVSVGVMVTEDQYGNKFYNVNLDPAGLAEKRKARNASQRQAGASEPSSTGPEQPGARIQGIEPVEDDGDTTLDQSIDTTGGEVNIDIGQTAIAEPAAGAPERRGSIRFGSDKQFIISLFEKADPSTLLHEFGHFFLEVFGDAADVLGPQDPATLTDNQRKLLADYGALLQWLGVDNRSAIDTPQHEQFAQGFEAYLFAGAAPSVGLRAAFSRFRAWLIGVYRSVTTLGVQLTPEVRGIFDRLIASDQAIAEAEAQRGAPALFTTADSAGMTAPEFALYTDTVETAHRTARERLDRELLAEVRREQTAIWQAQRDAIEAVVTPEIHAQPVYRALAAMQRGTLPNGDPLVEGMTPDPLKLSKDLIVERYGADRLKRLPRPYVYRVEGGLDPNTVADWSGFSSGDELLTAIEQAPTMAAVIQQETTRRMLAEHGSLLLDGTIGEAAQAAVANEDRDAILRAEMRALAALRRTVAPHVRQAQQDGTAAVRATAAFGDRAVRALQAQARGGAATLRAGIPSAAAIREAARTRIAGLQVRLIRPREFASAARRAGQQAIDHAARQDFDAAIVAKTQELFNVALDREATRVLEDVADRTRFAQTLTTPAVRARLGLAGGSYLDQIDGVLDRYSFAKASPKVLARLVSLRKWVAGLESQGLPVDLPEELLDDARHTNYQELTVEAFLGVTDGLKALVHLARLKTKLLKSADQREFAAVRDGLVDSIQPPGAPVRAAVLEFRPADAPWRTASDWFASHRKIADIAQALDRYVDGGPMWDAFMRPLNAAGDAEATRKQQAGGAYAAILEAAYPGRELGTLNEKIFIPAIQASLSKEGRLAVALNWGNQTSRDRLLADPVRQWSAPQIQAILDTLDQRDWTFVQATWDHLNTYWPEIAAKQQRVTGLEPERVEALPVSTRFGEFPGGYYPLAYDGRLSVRAGQHEAATAAKLATTAAYVRTTTKRGHVEARVSNVKLPVRLELSVAFQHLEQVIHDLTHHETLIDVTRLLRDPKVSQAILATQGDIVYRQLTKGLEDIAIGSTPAAGNVLDRAANYLKAGTQIAGLGWNLWTAAQQPLGLFNGMARVGPGWIARGLTRWARDAATMQHTATWIADVSPMMRARVMTGTQDLHDLRAAFRQPGGWFDTLVRRVSADHLTQQTITDSYLWHIGLMQRVADIPTWLGQYEKSRAAGESEVRAYALADQAVLDSQGGGQVKDLAQIQRGGPMARLFMTFYSYGNTVYNATAREIGQTDFKSPAQVGTFLGHLSLLYVMPALATVALSRAFGKSGGDDDEPEAFLADVGQEMLATALNTMVFVRELGGLAREGTRGYAGPAGARAFELATALWHQVEQGEPDEALLKAINSAAGVLFHYPAAQVQRTIDGWVALQEGRTRNPGVLLVGAPTKAAP